VKERLKTVGRATEAGYVAIERLRAGGGVAVATACVLKERSPTNSCVVDAGCIVNKRLKANGRDLIGRVVFQGLSPNGCILVTSGEAKERLRTKSRVVCTVGQAEEGSSSSLSRVSA